MAQAITILFVEDDPNVRDVLPDILPEEEFRSLVADDADEALRILAEERVDLMLTDVFMPGLDGVELAIEAKRTHPDLPVILMTGYISRATQAQAVGPLLFKPVRPHEIEAAIRAVLNLLGPAPTH